MDFRNNVPIWRVNGNSALDVVGLKEPDYVDADEKESSADAELLDRIKQRALSGEAFRWMPVTSAVAKVGRNDACPCGSGKKYKHCCGKKYNQKCN